MPVRCSTPADSGVLHGTPASMQATWTGRRAEFTRASTAMSAGSTPPARQASMVCDGEPGEPVGRRREHGDGAASAQRTAEVAGRRPGRRSPAIRGVDRLVIRGVRCRRGGDVAAVTTAGRTAVVDLQRVGAGAGEVPAIVDQELGVAPA